MNPWFGSMNHDRRDVGAVVGQRVHVHVQWLRAKQHLGLGALDRRKHRRVEEAGGDERVVDARVDLHAPAAEVRHQLGRLHAEHALAPTWQRHLPSHECLLNMRMKPPDG